MSRRNQLLKLINQALYIAGIAFIVVSMLLSTTNFPVNAETDNSTLVFEAGCTGSCNVLHAKICNFGKADMASASVFEVYFSANGDPQVGAQVFSGIVPMLELGKCAVLSYNPNSVAGNYVFKAYQTAGHSEPNVIWSNTCTIACSIPTPTETATFSPTPTSKFTATVTSTPTNTPTFTSTVTETMTPTQTSTVTSTSTATPTETATATASPTATSTATFTPTSTFTATATFTSTPTFTPTPEDPTPTPTNEVPTATPTNTSEVPTATPTNTSEVPTATPTNTSEVPTATPTNTSEVPTSTPTNTAEVPTATPTNTSVVPTATPTEEGPTATPQDPTPSPEGPTPTATTVNQTNTPGATLPPPPVVDTPSVLIPVTGADFSLAHRVNVIQNTYFNLGLYFLGFALVFNGVRRHFDL